MEIELPLARIRIGVRATSPIRFADYSGSAWRGLFGHALKRTVCVTRERHCEPCLLYQSCVYAYVFETPPPAGSVRLRGARAVPHPFVLRPDAKLRELPTGATTTLELTLIGKATRHLPYALYALQKAGDIGLGRGDGRFEVDTVMQEASPGSGDWRPILEDGALHPLPPTVPKAPPPPAQLTLRFDTPVRLKHEEHLLGPERFRFEGLVASLARRVASLAYFHGEGHPDLDPHHLCALAAGINPTRQDLRWHDWTRYSNRQQTRMQMGGLLGTLELDPLATQPLWPLLWLGQWIHVGKATSMGLGAYRINPASLPEQTRDAA